MLGTVCDDEVLGFGSVGDDERRRKDEALRFRNKRDYGKRKRERRGVAWSEDEFHKGRYMKMGSKGLRKIIALSRVITERRDQEIRQFLLGGGGDDRCR